jgi:thiosulfate reductase cytochrome b subunit
VARVYLYTLYERIWHWLQALCVLGLLATGVEMHWPDTVFVAGFSNSVTAHNILGLVLVGNAFLALFYHLTTGAIRQYIPEPRDFFTLSVKQARYYLRGIFRGEPHPFERNPLHKLNPLQQVTYLMILNVLLPLQVISGLLQWGAPWWPGLVGALGGLPVLAAVHSLGSWFFAAFLVAHVYLTTTGPTPLALLRAMITGWEQTEDSPVSVTPAEGPQPVKDESRRDGQTVAQEVTPGGAGGAPGGEVVTPGGQPVNPAVPPPHQPR